MKFTALHRAVGAAPGPLTNDLLDLAVSEGVTERDDLDALVAAARTAQPGEEFSHEGITYTRATGKRAEGAPTTVQSQWVRTHEDRPRWTRFA